MPTKAATTAELRRIAVCVDEPETACFARVPIEQEGIDHRLKFVVAKPAARLPRMLCTIARAPQSPLVSFLKDGEVAADLFGLDAGRLHDASPLP